MLRMKLFNVLVVLFVCTAVGSAQQDFSKVQMKATKVAGNIYMLEGAGGNIGVSVGPDGLLIVDDQFAPLADKIKAALKELSQGKLKFVINTHWHGDHTGSNAIFGAEVPIIAHANVRKRLSSENVNRAGQKVPPAPKEALPVITFAQTLSVHFNGEEIEAVYYPSGHTDGDGVIFFKGSNVVHLGDDFSPGRYPFIDFNSGGSADGLIKNLGNVVAKLPADVKIIPGHSPVSSLEDLRRYQQTLLATADIVRKQMQVGKTLEQIKQAGLPEEYKALGNSFVTTDIWIEAVYRSYGPKK